MVHFQAVFIPCRVFRREMMIEKIMPAGRYPSPKWIMPVLVLPVLLLTGLALPSHGAQWATETIDDPRFYMNFPLLSVGSRLALAADDTITLLYGDGPAGDLLLAQKKPDTDAWNFFTVFKDEYGTSARSPSLALDAQARPHVAYIQHYDYEKTAIQSAVLENGTWRVETVFSQAGTECILGTGVAVDNLANEHILFTSSTPEGRCRELKYAWKNAGQWSIETIETNNYVSIRPEGIAVDASATPHLIYSFYNGSDYELRHAVKINGSWQITSVDGADVFYPASISLDSSGRPHLAYSSYPELELKYAVFNGTEWQPQNIGVSGFEPSLLLDGNSTPHISFRNENGLFYTFFDGVQWQTTCLDPESYVGLNNSITMDSQSRIHISYAGKNDATRHAFFDGTGWQNEIVDIWRTVSGQSIALDSWGRPHISYSHGSSEIQYARHDGRNWRIETVATGPFGESYTTPTSLALDILNHPHISFYDWSGADLKYAHNNGSGWRIHTVDSEGDVGLSSSIALDSASSPHVSYLDLTQNRIKYAYLNNDAWVTESIAPPYSPLSIFSETDLLLDHLSQPHLIVRNENSLYYWSKSDNAWQAELVASDVNLSASPGFALDRQARPCVTYQDANEYNLRYGCRDDAQWHFTTIDESEGYRGQAASLVFDRLSMPHISYSESKQNGYALQHAYRTGDTWQIDTVKFPSFPFTIDSAISRTGQLHISFVKGAGEYALEHASALFPQPKFPWQVLFPGLIQNGKKYLRGGQ
jgi:hypothetical protein